MKNFMEYCVDNPKKVTGLMALLTIVLAVLAAVPSVWPDKVTFLHPAEIDTDPENMLPASEPVRVFHKEMKKEFGLWDMLVVGVLNEEDPDGVFNPDTLKRVKELTDYAKTLQWPLSESPKSLPHDPDQDVHAKAEPPVKDYAGVIAVDIMSPATADNIIPGAGNKVEFEQLMKTAPETREEALKIRDSAARLPMLLGTVVSDGDGAKPKALALYIPLTDKHLSYKVAGLLRKKIDTLGGNDEWHITGLPIAEDTFGVEMFKQMAMSAPLAMLIIFLLMWYFFHKIALIASPMIVAMVCVIQTMGLLVVTGNTIHIMSSMIPIFIMPIAVLDAIHILSEFFDRYQETKDRRAAILSVMETLFGPMLYTSLTTMVGFASLALTPIPPVQVFGLFVAFGVAMAWIWTVVFIPASVMFISQDSLKNFGLTAEAEELENHSAMHRVLQWLGKFTSLRARGVIAVTLIASAIAAWGISQININDNPIRWFEPAHEIRVADRKLNEHFAGTYMAYLALSADASSNSPESVLAEIEKAATAKKDQLKKEGFLKVDEVFTRFLGKGKELASSSKDADELLRKLDEYALAIYDDQKTPEDELDAWDAASLFAGEMRASRSDLFKDPALLNWMMKLQDYLLTIKSEDGRELVGKSSSLADIVRTVNRDLHSGKEEFYSIPDSRAGVAQTIMQFQNSNRPGDLWHFVEKPDQGKGKSGYGKTSLWVQLKSGDNRDMQEVADAVGKYIKQNPAPRAITPKWFGLTYINVIWQDKMVSGMGGAFLGSFLVVLFMMMVLFRSALWGLLSMVPLTVTIGMIYGMIGIIGKDYDMPVAVLSSLSLGLAVDYAIHFLARGREIRAETGNWKDTVPLIFGEPARAITRNVLVVGIGFLPLLFAPLVPYKTVGIFIAAILITAGVASLFILPALMKLMEGWLFPKTDSRAFACHCGTCVFGSGVLVALVAVNVYQFLNVGVTKLTWMSVAAFIILGILCRIASKSRVCSPKTGFSGSDKK